ncbi:MAG: hypothetical protein HY329_16285 [Chloroflexi bacterium]|nr:hypothetical protein [Chloroflexota bacterium]
MGWMDKISKGITDAAGDAERFARIQKMKNVDMATLRTKRSEALQAIGERAYDMQKSGLLNEPQLVALIEQVRSVEAEMTAKENEIKEMEQQQRTSIG